jgi:hypothetical protein
MKFVIKYLLIIQFIVLIIPLYPQSGGVREFVNTCMTWQDTISLQSDEFLFALVFGGNPDATDDFDLGVDFPSAPPGMTYFACFPLPVFPGQLLTDIRKWIEPDDQPREWAISVSNAIGKKTLMKWKVKDLPVSGQFNLIGLKLPINMHLQDTVTFAGNKDLKIQYQISSAIQPANMPESLFPDDFSLFQNYPNPFNSRTTISYYLKKPIWVELKIFNLIGNEVAILHQGQQSSGFWVTHWDGRTQQDQPAASGVYFYQLKVGGQSEIKKLILLP